MVTTDTTPTRDRLIAATVDALRTDGVAGLTSREVTRRAGANLQAITYHFGSKDTLVAEALTHLVRHRLDPIRAALDQRGDPADRLVAALRVLHETFAVARADLETYADAVAASSTNAVLRASLSQIHAELVEYLAGLIRELRSRDEIAPWVEPVAMAELLIAIGDGIATHARFGDPDVPGVLDQVSLLLLSARGSKMWKGAAKVMLGRLRPS